VPGSLGVVGLRQGVRMLLFGVMPGFVIAFIGAGFLRHLLYGIEPHDPLAFVAVPLALVLVGLAASYLSARRAATFPNYPITKLPNY
jgi:hypothetical protein